MLSLKRKKHNYTVKSTYRNDVCNNISGGTISRNIFVWFYLVFSF